jgi:hypothetical protein
VVPEFVSFAPDTQTIEVIEAITLDSPLKYLYTFFEIRLEDEAGKNDVYNY